MLADKLQTILINKEYAIKMAIENHRKSKLYKKDILDTKRERFWDDFISSFIKNQ